MNTRSRLWQFSGDNDAYCRFLEDTLMPVYEEQPLLFPQLHKQSLRPFKSQPSVDNTKRSPEKTPSPTPNNLKIEIWTPSTTSKQPRKPSPSHVSDRWLTVIKKIPQDEEQWQSARRDHGLDTREHILLYLSEIHSCSWRHEAGEIQGYSLSELADRALRLCRNATKLQGLSNLISFLFVATCCVDEAVDEGNSSTNAALNSFFQALHPEEWSDESGDLRRIKTGVIRVIGMIDRLFDLIGHRAFELLIYMTPTTLRRVTQSDVDHTISFVSKQRRAEEVLAKEVQATEPLYVVHLLKLWRPDLTYKVIGDSLGTSLFNHGKVLPPSSLGKRRRDDSDDRISQRDSGRQYDPIRDTGNNRDSHADGEHPFDPSLHWANGLNPGSPSSYRSASCFSDSRISNATDLTSVSTRGSSPTGIVPDIDWSGEPCGGSRPLSAGNGPMLCPDVGMDEETRNLASCGLTKGSDYVENATLPSQNMNFEGDDDWIRAIEAGEVTSIGPREEVWFQP
ncbi:hypothetical protein AK830_g2833 [Neonectria ditissima]|uniref:Uncharacterized protein n=1 Tax=Neonectria ditissima TaxID=78410 RepID=A0A0P7BRA1_9HYPO|nr:hypothetical protein AK830_g2833 [Neonectria ditissima]